MTAPVASTPAPPPPSRANTGSDSRGDAGSNVSFDRQLEAASQRMTGNASDRQAPDSRQAAIEPSGSTPAADADKPVDARLPPDAMPLSSAVTATLAEVAGDEAGDRTATESDEVDDLAASSLASAMLALLGPAVASVLRPADSGVSDAAGSAMGLQPAAAGLPSGVFVMRADLLADDAAELMQLVTTTPGEPSQPVALHAGPAPAVPATTHLLQVPTPASSPAFARDLGQQVMWLGGQDIKQARIRLHPEELGSLDVSISVNHARRVDVVFSAQHPGAVTAVQQSLPQLEQMLAQHGLSLGHAEVGQRGHGGQGDGGDGGRSDSADDAGENPGATQLASSGVVGLVDAFA